MYDDNESDYCFAEDTNNRTTNKTCLTKNILTTYQQKIKRIHKQPRIGSKAVD